MFRGTSSFRRSSDRVEKARAAATSTAAMAAKVKRAVMRDPAKLSRLQQTPGLTSPIVTFTVGAERRLFAAHEDVLAASPVLAAACRAAQEVSVVGRARRPLELLFEEPEVFSCVLEYLYKGDYYPRLLHNKRRNTWELEDAAAGPVGATICVGGGGGDEGELLLRDSVIYCAAERYGLEGLKRIALRKQGLHGGIEVATVLRSARYAYEHTPDTDARLRAHYLALIIRCRGTFKRSGTMQREMASGGRLFFDLFVALCNHVDDIVDKSNRSSPRTI